MKKEEKTIIKRKKLKERLPLILILLLMVTVVVLGYSYYNLQKTIKTITDPKVAEKYIKEQTQSVVERLSKHIILPMGESPTFATITDINALKKEQPFYEGCENGDQILIYKNARIGIVYRPSKDIIVKVGPVEVED
mgnify:CR=1 FL=1|uniref:Uncharacterized protein n=1 Tax=candidate division CPR3 bacterium TaxID=2268181 RepID=A0A7C4M2G1_UNCC3